MQWILLMGSIVAAWALLSIVGGERQRRIDEFEAKARADAEQAKTASDEPYTAR